MPDISIYKQNIFRRAYQAKDTLDFKEGPTSYQELWVPKKDDME